MFDAPNHRIGPDPTRIGAAIVQCRVDAADWTVMSSQAWFVAASVSGTACATLAVVVIVAGWRRRIAEVVMLGAALFVVSVLATSSGAGGTSLGGGVPGAHWAGMLALPAGVTAAAPLIASSTRFGRRVAAHHVPWVTTWAGGAALLALALVRIDAAPPLAATVAGVIVGVVGASLLVHRQLILFRISRRTPALVTSAAVAAIAIASTAALTVSPGSSASWGLLAMENAGVLGAGIAVLIGYRHGHDVADVLAPILAREPLAALELGLSPEVHAFVAALGRKDTITRDHVVRTSALAMRVAMRAGLAPPRIRAVAVGALLHDIGKLVIPSDIINKAGSLTDAEFATIKTHPEQGERLLADAPGLVAAAPHVRGHHERVDGRGYPDGLIGDEVTFEVGLVSVADAWDAMTHTRQYREGMGTERAAAILRDGAGSQWRVDAVELLLAEVAAGGQVDLDSLDSLRHGEPTADEIAGCVCDNTIDIVAPAPPVAPARATVPSQSSIDDITGVANRRGFEVAARKALATDARCDGPPQLVFVGVEGLDEIGEQFGQAGVDDALRSAALILSNHARAGDIVGRLGHDEFAVLLPDAPAGAADELARRVRAAASTDQAGSRPSLRLRIGTATTLPDDATAFADARAVSGTAGPSGPPARPN